MGEAMGVDRRTLLVGAGVVGVGAVSLSEAAAAAPPLHIPTGGGDVPDVWRKAEQIALWPGTPPGGPFTPLPRPAGMAPTFVSNVDAPVLRVFRPARSNGRALLVMPGGAYTFVSIRNEGVDVARVFNARGYTVFVLTYRLPGEGWQPRADVPLQDAQRAMRLIRSRAARYGIDPSRVAMLGFSAGGHLGASLLTGYDERVYAPVDAADRETARPACGGLIYPVIAADAPYTHGQSARMLLGPNPAPALIERRSPARHVTPQTPPTFLVHSIDDDAVPWQNARMFLDALRAAKVRAEAHFFEEGGHGYGIGPDNAPAGLWPHLFALWLERTLG
ncbi:xylanase [Sphingomonas metalli]|uniref:Xylanase n=1 Tax=Sphingomonas metalli TaxID=1779358 RepID=A0A916T924_9SPHN|nr:alpha/beta hydrolase [Sphingomonas metalli]GGB36233.1 xylanase [Sphingomonas metalli]